MKVAEEDSPSPILVAPVTPGTLTWLYVFLQLAFLEALLRLQLRSPEA